MGINFMEEDAPDATTLLKFRRLLEEHGLNKVFFEAINRVMVETGHMLKGGTIVDATIINAPPSTKNTQKARDPEIHQTKKGNEWRLGIEKREKVTSDKHLSGIDYRINRRPGSLQKVSNRSIDWDRVIEHAKSSIRCKVEHPFRTIKCLFGYRKTVYKGLAKNENRLYALFASANLYALASCGRSLCAAW